MNEKKEDTMSVGWLAVKVSTEKEQWRTWISGDKLIFFGTSELSGHVDREGDIWLMVGEETDGNR